LKDDLTEELGMGDWRLRSIHLTSATIRQCWIYTCASFARTKAGFFLHQYLAEMLEAVSPWTFHVRWLWHLLPHAESLYYKAYRRTSARTEVLVVETIEWHGSGIGGITAVSTVLQREWV